MIKIAICEDREDSAALLLAHLDRYAAKHGEEFSYTRFPNGLVFIEEYRAEYDVVFMDIDMPIMNGMEAAKRLRERDPYVPLVFITDLRQFALKGYEVEALDYLVKPVAYPAFEAMMARVRKNLAKKQGESLVLQTSQGAVKVKIEDILYLEVAHHYVIYHTVAGEISFFGSLSEEEKRLPAELFIRCNSCFLVNLSRVTKVQDGEAHLGAVCRLPISRNKKAAFMEKLLEYMGGR